MLWLPRRLATTLVVVGLVAGCSSASGEDLAEFSSGAGTDSGSSGQSTYDPNEGSDSSGAEDETSSDEGGDAPPDPTGSEPPPDSGAGAEGLLAAEWSDLDNWAFWTDLVGQEPWADQPAHWGFFTATSRIPVTVVQGGEPIADATVVLVDKYEGAVWRARTDAAGEAHMYAGLFGQQAEGPLSVHVTGMNETLLSEPVEAVPGTPVMVDVSGVQPPPPVLDLMLVVDTTSSMEEELSYLQQNLASVVGQVRDQARPDLLVRISVNFYRDEADDYVLRSFPFTENVEEAVAQLSEQDADGGGDFPEAVDVALDDAVFNHNWSASAQARLLFLVLDAPPHHNTDSLKSLRDSTLEAAHKGIHVIPIGGTEIDEPTEFLVRFIDIATSGTFVFVAGGNEGSFDLRKPTVGEVVPEPLDTLIARLVLDALG